MADRLFIFDTTLRDGEQVPGCQLNTVEKIQVAKQLEEISKAVTWPTICALTRAVEKDIDVAAEALQYAKHKRIHTGIGTSPSHIKYKFNSTPEEIVERAVAAVKYAKKYVEDVEFYAEDAGRTDNEYLARVIDAVTKAGATPTRRVSACQTNIMRKSSTSMSTWMLLLQASPSSLLTATTTSAWLLPTRWLVCWVVPVRWK